MSAPATNALPAPRSTIVRTSARPSASSNFWASCETTSSLSAFIASGRLRVISARRPSPRAARTRTRRVLPLAACLARSTGTSRPSVRQVLLPFSPPRGPRCGSRARRVPSSSAARRALRCRRPRCCRHPPAPSGSQPGRRRPAAGRRWRRAGRRRSTVRHRAATACLSHLLLRSGEGA